MCKLEFDQWTYVTRSENWKAPFRRGAITRSTRSRQVPDWVSDIEQVASKQDLDEEGSVFGCTRMQSEALHETSSGGQKNARKKGLLMFIG